MNTPVCPVCGRVMTRHGTTSAGKTRWRCRGCSLTQVGRIDATAKHLQEFVRWLLSRQRQRDMPGHGRSFRRRTTQFWQLWPMPAVIDQCHDVVFVDGIHLGRRAVVLIARTDQWVLGWYVARSENTRAWSALLSRIAPAKVVVTDGGSGLASALRAQWPDTRVQRCVFHAFTQMKTATTTRPRLPAGQELYALGKRLVRVQCLDDAYAWVVDYNQWCSRWSSFLAEKTQVDGRLVATHQPLVTARNAVNRLIVAGTLFTFLDPVVCEGGLIVPATNNLIEGGTNAQLRAMLRDHRGLSLVRRIKAIFWWCDMHTQYPLPAREVLKVMPTDSDIEQYYQRLHEGEQMRGSVPGWGDAIAWHELHRGDRWYRAWD